MGKDGCELTQWSDLYGRAVFARHPEGFPVFLSPAELEVPDEYRDSDPYGVEQSLDGPFQTRRIACTLELLGTAVRRLSSPRILDLGCGPGHITQRIHQGFPKADLFGLDYSVSAIRYAVHHFPGIDFVAANAYDAPYFPGYFDVVLCNNLWEHIPDPLRLLGHIVVVMKPDGYLVLSTPSRYRLGNLLRVLCGKTVELASEHHVTEYTVGQVYEQLRYRGFRVLRSMSRPDPRIRTWSKAGIVQAIFSQFIRWSHSHHQLEATVFYLAQHT